MSSDTVAASNRNLSGTVTPGSPEIAQRILDEVTQLAPRLRARAAEAEQLRRVPDENIRELADAGVFKMAIPVEYGGYALKPSQFVPVFAEVAKACGSTGWITWLGTTGMYPVTLYSHKFQEELFTQDWKGPLQAGSLKAIAPGVGRRVTGGLMVKGKWGWISGCHHTRFYMLSVMVDTDDGGKVSIACQIPREEVQILDDWQVMGMAGSGSNTVAIEEEVFVPDHRTLVTFAVFTTKPLDPAPAGLLFKANFAQVTSITIAALGIGLARAAIEEFQKKSQGRTVAMTTYTDQSQAPVAHLQLGEMWAKLNAAEAVLERSARLVESDAESGIHSPPISIAKLRAASAFVCAQAKDISDIALRASGASSIFLGNPLQRIMRDATTLSMHAQTSIEPAYEDLGRQLAGLPGFLGPKPKPKADAQAPETQGNAA